MTFSEANDYSDIVISRMFEGVDTVYKYNETELKLVKLTQADGLLASLTPEARKRYISKLFR